VLLGWRGLTSGPARPGSQGILSILKIHPQHQNDPSSDLLPYYLLAMSPSPSLALPWAQRLEHAAEQLDGGARSFPEAEDTALLPNHIYSPPNEQYEKLFFFKATVSGSQPNRSTYSAGWLLPGEATDCHPVFVAHSTLSAIWLLRETLPASALDDAAWERLTQAACELAQGEEEAPPSAQPSHSLPKRSAPPLPSPTRKRARVDSSASVSDTASVQELEPNPPPSPSQEPVLITTTTNNNRRAERARIEKRKVQALKKRQTLGLVEPCEAAPPAEHAAYASILPKDEPIIAWIIKQRAGDSDFYTTARSPYVTATSMLEKAYALGNESAQYHAVRFLQSWRTYGSPFPSSTSSFSTTPPTSSFSTTPQAASSNKRRRLPWLYRNSPSQRSTTDNLFRDAWGVVDHYETQMAAIHIQYRWAMAFLGRAYADKITLLEREDQARGKGQSRSRDGRGNLRTEARTALLPLVYGEITSRERSICKKRLQRATRWYNAAMTLGWGSLCLMPYETISNAWAEQKLRVGEWQTWLDLVKEVNPDAHTASQALDAWLGSEITTGGPIRDKDTLYIEATLPTTVYEIEEVLDSDDEEDEDVLAPSPVSDAGSARPMRQLTLPELFKPR
jgi:hypothetical protein